MEEPPASSATPHHPLELLLQKVHLEFRCHVTKTWCPTGACAHITMPFPDLELEVHLSLTQDPLPDLLQLTSIKVLAKPATSQLSPLPVANGEESQLYLEAVLDEHQGLRYCLATPKRVQPSSTLTRGIHHLITTWNLASTSTLTRISV